MDLPVSNSKVVNQRIILPEIDEDGPALFMKRLDLLHQEYGGNKYFKLFHHLEKAKMQGKTHILSYGGPYSNHIYALASICCDLGLTSIGIIRGFDHYQTNPTLQFATHKGMILKFLAPGKFNLEEERKNVLSQLNCSPENVYAIPEGGTDAQGVKGASKMLQKGDEDFSHLCIGVGSGGSVAGVINASYETQKVMGFVALKGAHYLEDTIRSLAAQKNNWQLIHDFHFGGFAKINEGLIHFAQEFKSLNGFAIDPVYQIKMLFGIREMIRNEEFLPQDRILTFHTGGLQAWAGFETKISNAKH